MKIITYTDVHDFITDTFDSLLKNEAQNNLLLGNAIKAKEGGVEDAFFITVKDKLGKVILSGGMIAPFNLVVYETDNIPCEEARLCLAQALAKLPINPPGFIGEENLVKRLDEVYCSLTGKSSQVQMHLNLLNLTKVNDLPKAKGRLRLATLDDLFFLPYWEEAFIKECGLPCSPFKETVDRVIHKIEAKKVYLWEDGHPVSMVQQGRQLMHGVAITCVYTPDFFRGNHYARTCVSTFTRQLLEEGNKFCCLFADGANPISNKIYQQIGYEHVCVFDEIMLKEKEENKCQML